MRVVKITLIVGSIIILFLLSAAMLLPRKISIAKSVLIHSDDDCPREMVLTFNRWQTWFPAVKEGISALHILSDQEAEITAHKDKAGLVTLFGNTRDSFGFTLRMKSEQPVVFNFFAYTEKNGDHRLDLVVNTVMHWYPWERLKGVFIDKLAGPQYQLALDNIARACREE